MPHSFLLKRNEEKRRESRFSAQGLIYPSIEIRRELRERNSEFSARRNNVFVVGYFVTVFETRWRRPFVMARASLFTSRAVERERGSYVVLHIVPRDAVEKGARRPHGTILFPLQLAIRYPIRLVLRFASKIHMSCSLLSSRNWDNGGIYIGSSRYLFGRIRSRTNSDITCVRYLGCLI